ncbi:MAG: hypothetical protein AVDCRST_MAG76-689 [uncultured Acidimicrobiales bacterium]|uniref:Uncharacterized protein n=1 Tax=uncultured Acidimicrobiales bacterium TaxID=310071 RepID=A0A6J4HCH2_9ACTN|nr:MAG: hypothetical protein AVDCRST_MAG76-689 [uncultured Acidimicrobiales bacterium]
MSDVLPDPCPICGFDGRSLRPPDILATLRSLGRRWAGVLSPDREGVAKPHAEAALDGLLAAARPIRAEVGRFGTRPEATAAGIATAADAIVEALEGADKPFERPGVHEAAVAAAHSGIHHLRLAEKAR